MAFRGIPATSFQLLSWLRTRLIGSNVTATCCLSRTSKLHSLREKIAQEATGSGNRDVPPTLNLSGRALSRPLKLFNQCQIELLFHLYSIRQHTYTMFEDDGCSFVPNSDASSSTDIVLLITVHNADEPCRANVRHSDCYERRPSLTEHCLQIWPYGHRHLPRK